MRRTFTWAQARPSSTWVISRSDSRSETLKDVQRQLLELLGPLLDSPILYGISAERVWLHAAQAYERQLWVGTLDIKDHFDNITEAHVRALMAVMGCPSKVADVLVPLVTYRGRLGQGLPTSNVIADLLLTGLDRRVHQVALQHGVGVTRVADDFAISGQKRKAVLRVMEFIEGELRDLGLTMNQRKRTFEPRHRRQDVHGVTLNNEVAIPKRRGQDGRLSRKQLRSEIRRVRKYGCTESVWNRLQGLVGHVGRLHPQEAARMRVDLQGVQVGT